MKSPHQSHPQVTLRALEPEDLDLLYQIENDRDHWAEGVTNVPYSRYLLRQFISDSTCDIYRDGQVRMVVQNEKHQPVGFADLVNFSPAHLRAELGLITFPAQRRKGYATAALEAVRLYARTVLHLHQLYCIVGSSNESCLRLFHAAGLKSVATLTDWLFDGRDYHDAVLVRIPL
jgi:diamine N-acetyltransferase